jgi:hypothetical protein
VTVDEIMVNEMMAGEMTVSTITEDETPLFG